MAPRIHGGKLFRQARRDVLGMSQGELGRVLGASARTIMRWESSSDGGRRGWAGLIRLIHAHDATLAAQMAAYAGGSIESFIPTHTVASHLVDAVVCAAAEAIDSSPRALRIALRAAFARAAELGLSVEDVHTALTNEAPGR